MAYVESSRDALPSGESYPIGREALDAALAAAGVERLDHVYFLRAWINEWRSAGGGTAIRIDFKAATRHTVERIEARIQAVPSPLKQEVQTGLSACLGAVASWIRAAETSENVWRSHDHALVLAWDGSRISAREE